MGPQTMTNAVYKDSLVVQFDRLEDAGKKFTNCSSCCSMGEVNIAERACTRYKRLKFQQNLSRLSLIAD